MIGVCLLMKTGFVCKVLNPMYVLYSGIKLSCFTEVISKRTSSIIPTAI